MIYKIASVAAALGSSYVSSEFTDFKLVSSIDFEHPAFLDFVTLNNEQTIDLSVTVFSMSASGKAEMIKNVTNVFTDPDYAKSLVTDVISEDYLWPNVFERVPDGVFCEEKKKVLCGGQECTIMSLGDGFLVPGHQTGSVYLQPVHASGMDAISPIKIADEEKFWYYHSPQWADVDGDGLQDIIIARAWTNNVGKTKGELVWFRQPTDASDVTSLWPMSTLHEGPDILTLVDTSVEGLISVYSPEFWGEKLSLTVIKVGETPEVISYDILDEELGPGYCVYMRDVDGDGIDELVVNNHQHTDGSISAYEIPQYTLENVKDVLAATRADGGWEKHVISTGYPVVKKLPSEASPGMIYPFFPAKSTAVGALALRPWWLVAGDGSHAVHIVYPVEDPNDPYAYVTEQIIEIDGTVGSLALLQLDNGSLGVVAPNYDESKLYFYSFFNDNK